MAFVHLHNHTQYSLLDGACRVDKMLAIARNQGMPAAAITDHGNMFGVIDFYKTARQFHLKPILGMEAYIINGELDNPESKKDPRYHLILLAQNRTGYRNLMKLSSKAYLQGFYYRPRISKSLLRKYSSGLICLSACLKGEVASLILRDDLATARQVINFYKEIFQDNYYLELQDHGLEEEKQVSGQLVELAKLTDTPLVVTNDCHYLHQEDYEAHDVLLCIQTGKLRSDTDRMRYKTDQLYFKSEKEMMQLFPELPAACENTVKIAEQVDLTLDYSTFLLPRIDIPPTHQSMQEYLRFLCLQEMEKKYPDADQEIRDRIEYELSIINRMGYEGYFLIVKDIIDAARNMDVPVGPGRGSAVGSVVSYLLGITEIEPLKYSLFFERFLNPDRVGMPDIDIDLCAEGRGKVIEYVVNKYGRESVAQIITMGTLGAKLVIKDVARALDVPPSKSNDMTREIPGGVNITLRKALKLSRDFATMMQENKTNESLLKYSLVLEGLIRHISIHAAGIVIVPGKISDYVPLAVIPQKSGEDSVLVQYEGRWLEDLKILKIDLLGLKTLTLIKKTADLIRESCGKEIRISEIDLTDQATYRLIAQGQTNGIFQFESPGMKKYLMNLKPNVFEDLIAMVALYRPGPMQFIDSFISRKHGKEKIHYVHPLTEQALRESYGVTVYQEQVMQIAREMGGLSGAEADTLRKAISKKKLSTMEKLKNKFMEGARQNNVNDATIEKIWNNWLEFANYAFNKSHATAYAYVAFQTAYLKAHYPVEFMAALLSLEENPTKITFFIDECRKMGIEVEPPNINESCHDFTVRGKKILFGLKAIKNVGEGTIRAITEERDRNGQFSNLFEFCSRLDCLNVNKSILESLIASGAMDDLEGSRAQKYEAIESALEYASALQNERKRGQMMFFDSFSEEEEQEYFPELPHLHDWSFNYKLKKEREILGFYWSGHPLHKYSFIIDNFSLTSSRADVNELKSNSFAIAGVVSEIIKKTDKKGNSFAIIIMEDLEGKFELCLFNQDYETYYSRIEEGKEFFIIGNRSSFSNENEDILRVIPRSLFDFDQLDKNISGDVYLRLNESNATPQLAAQITAIAGMNPGKFNIHFLISSSKYNKEMMLHSRKLKIFPGKSFFDYCAENNLGKPKIKLDL
ncbi:MAG: DNA polymerase III subunit alpha [Candidatus Cloacimonetes bacterium]|nr:DNA polymerase III subunit alpha [Candidatus Cloacimonadota bacterium]